MSIGSPTRFVPVPLQRRAGLCATGGVVCHVWWSGVVWVCETETETDATQSERDQSEEVRPHSMGLTDNAHDLNISAACC